MQVSIIQYNAGNIQSVLFALARLGIEGIVTGDPEKIRSTDRVIFPGVGEAGSAMAYLKQNNLDVLIKDLKQPVLGICLGMQLLCAYTDEGDTEGLNIFPARVKRFDQPKVPHMGWNKIRYENNKLFHGVPGEAYCYFVHSYYAGLCLQTTSVTEYGVSFSSSLQKDNFYGVQFHPEKSAKAGQQILQNFLSI